MLWPTFLPILLICWYAIALPVPEALSSLEGSEIIQSRHGGPHNATHRNQEEAATSHTCGAEAPPESLLGLHKILNTQELLQRRGNRKPAREMISVKTWFWFITREDKNISSVPIKGLQDQFEVLNDAFAPAQIQFHLQGIEVAKNNSWTAGIDPIEYEPVLRKGHYTDLNIWFVDGNLSPYDTLTRTLYGDTKFPNRFITALTNLTGIPIKNRLFAPPNVDGVRVRADSIPGAKSKKGMNLGRVVVHEVGHWFGLLHTFSGGRCDSVGDFNDDTPQQRMPTSYTATKDGCFQKGQEPNTCPDLHPDRPDPYNNYMDYGSDIWFVQRPLRTDNDLLAKLKQP